jgi:hypothetical protein
MDFRRSFAMRAQTHGPRVPAAAALPPRDPLAATASGRPPSNLLWWYLGLTPHWIGGTPRRCQLLLRTHEWIVDRILAPEVTLPAAVADLHPDGALARALIELVPPDETEGWRQFIRLVVAKLRRALLQPVTRRDEAWVRWLFLIPYTIPMTPATRAAATR